MADNLKIVVGSKQDWEAGILPPQVDTVSSPGFVQLYRPSLSLTRASTAYLPDGSQIASGLARYWWGKYHNLITQNSDFEAVPSVGGAWSTFTVTQTVDPSTFVKGSKSLKVVVTGTPGSGGTQMFNLSPRIPVKPSTSYVYSVYVKASANTTMASHTNMLYAIEYDSNLTQVTERGYNTVNTFGTDWVRISGSFVTQANTSLIILASYAYEPATFWFDCAQFEQGTIATDWRLGGTGKSIMVEEGTTQLVMNSDFEVLNPTKQRVFFDDFNRVGSATFTRASAANNPITGVPVASGIPRYVPGRFQNLLTANQSNIETDVSTWTPSANGVAYAQDTTTSWQGTSSLKVTTDATLGGQGIFIMQDKCPSCSSSTTYTWSTYVKGVGTLTLTPRTYDAANGTIGGDGQNVTVTLTGSWQRITVSRIVESNAAKLGFKLYRPTNQSGDFWADGFQIEQGSSATDWRVGGSGMGVIIEEGTKNLVPNTNGRPTTMTTAGTTPPTASLVTTASNPFGTEAWQVDFPANGTTSYTGSRVTSDTWAAVINLSYSYSVWIKGDTTNLGIYHTGVDGNNTMIKTGKQIGGWYEYVKDNHVIGTSGNNFLTVYLGIATAAVQTVYVAVSQVEQKAYHTSFVNGTRNAETLTVPTTGMSPTQGTIELWATPSNASLNPTKLASGSCLFSYTGTPGSRWDIWYNYNNKAIGVYNGAVSKWLESASVPFNPNTLHYIAVTYSTTEGTKLYIDGVLSASDATMTTMPTFSPNFYIGDYAGSIGGYCSDGMIDAVRLSNVVRTATEITAYYNATSPLLDDKTVILLNMDNDLDGEMTVQAGWDMTNSGTADFHLKGNTLHRFKVGTNDPRIFHGDIEWTNTIQTYKVTRLSNSGAIGFYFRENNGKRWGVYHNSGNWNMSKWNTPTTAFITSSALGNLSLNVETTITISVTGTKVTLDVGGIKVFDNYDLPDIVPSGRIGIFLSDGSGLVADIAIINDIEVKADVPDAWIYNFQPFSLGSKVAGARLSLTSGYNSTRALKISGATKDDELVVFSKKMQLITNTTYTLSFRYKRVVTGILPTDLFVISDTGNYVQGSWSIPAGIDSGWNIFTATFTTTANITGTEQFIRFDGQYGNSIAIDCVQVEQKPYATSYHRNDSLTVSSVREVEIVSMPATGLSPMSGSVEFWWTPTQPTSGIISQSTSPRIFQIGDYYNNASLTLWAWYSGTSGGEPSVRLYLKGQTNPSWSIGGSLILAGGTGWYAVGKPVRFIVSWLNGNTFYVNINGTEYGPYTIADTITSWAANTIWLGSNATNSCANAYYDDFRASSVKRTAQEALAAYNATQSIGTDANTVFVARFDDSLVSEYAPIATIITKPIDLGSIHAGPIDLTTIATTPNGTNVKLNRYRTSSDGINWNEWRVINE